MTCPTPARWKEQYILSPGVDEPPPEAAGLHALDARVERAAAPAERVVVLMYVHK